MDNETIADAVGALLQRTGFTLGTLESGTGGPASSNLTTATAGAQSFVGGLLAHDPQILTLFGIPLPPPPTPSLPHSPTPHSPTPS